MTFCLGLISIQGLAADRSFKVKSSHSDRGEVRYKINSGTWSAWAPSHDVTAADNATIYVEAQKKSGNTAYGFSRWYLDVENKPVNYSTNTSFSFKVSSSIQGKSATARFDAWVEDLIAGATYTITNTTTDFTVTCSNTSSPCHNKTYSFIGNVTVKSGKVKIVFNTKKYCLMTGTILVQKGDLEMSLGDGYAFNADHRNTLHRAWGFKGELVKVKPAKRNPGDPANVYTDYKLTIKGKPSDDHSKDFSIFGNYALARMDSTLVAGTVDTYTNYHLVNNDEDMLVNSTLVSLDGGIIDFDYVMVGYNWHTGSQSGIFFGGNGATEGDKIKLEAELDHCLLQWCYGYLYGAACKVDNYVRGSWVRMTDCEVRYCENGNNGDPSVNLSSGGAVRSSGNNLCSLTMTRCYVHHNCTPARGGGIRWNAAMINPSLVLENCVVRRNWAGEYGGGMRVEGQADVTGCSFTDNRAEKSGGGLSLGPFLGGGPAHLYVGGGVWFPKDCSIELDADSKVENNTAAEYGGGIYINVEYTTLEGGTTNGQTFDPWTVYLNDQYEPYKGVLVMNGASVKNNTAGIDGGAVYMTRNTNYYGLVTDLNSGTIDNNTAMGNGGAFCLTEDITVPVSPNPTVFVYQGTTYNLVPQGIFANLGTSDPSVTTDLTMINNTAVNGGGIYVKSGNVSVYGNAVVGGSTANANKSIGGNGGGIYVTGGNLHMYAGEISHNQAKKSGSIGGKGGGTFVDGGDVTIENGNIDNNQADVDGGGLYSSGVVEFSNGSIRNNMASQNGGGIYIPSTGSLNISGTATLTGNNVANGWGGGIYQGGIMTADGESLTVRGNTKGAVKDIISNNVYLPNNKTIKVLGDIDPTGVDLGIYTENEAVVGNHSTDIPVLTADEAYIGRLQEIYEKLQDATSRITDDRNVHRPRYTVGDNTLYFTKLIYDYSYNSDFENPINNLSQLYKYMCWVNGINGFSKHSDAIGNVTADIDMHSILHWVPIGENEFGQSGTDAFQGTFNGNGHTISGLTIDGTGGFTNYGLFGQTSGATITDINMKDCSMSKSSDGGSIGAIVGTMSGGTITGCIVSGDLTATATDCVTGGLVGKVQSSAAIHSSCATPTITGYQMGGLVGDLGTSGTLKNSFASVEFSALGSTSFMGGLVGENAGTVENCYSRVRGVVPATTYFGYLAGDNDGGILKYSYSAEDDYVSTNGTAGTQTGIGTYSPTTLVNGKYGYLQEDQQIDATNSHVINGTYSKTGGLTGLLATLNHWVNSAEGGAQYAQWMRTSASPINGDYPIFNYGDYVCVGSKDNVALEYSDSFTTLFDSYLTASSGAGVGTVYLFKNPGTSTITLSNNNKNTELYIHEDVALLHSSVLKAHVGITLDNSAGSGGANPSYGGSDAIDWHFFSSSLSNAPIGLTYGDDESYGYGEYPTTWQTAFTDANGYFPTNFNTDVHVDGDYYTDWDLYSYSEPEYHWINLKRNSYSHCHEDFDHGPITYTNPTLFNPGQGFLVATAEESYLQAYGTLNTHTSNFEKELSYTVGVSWTGRQGLNLLGNPYQSYLDFDAFATTNSGGSVGKIWSNINNASYIIMDEDDPHRGYVQYAYDQSHNTFGANRYLHPHQGFMVVAGKTGLKAVFNNDMRDVTASATFRDGGRINYPLVNLFATDDNGNRDMVTVELGRPDKGGALKLHSLHAGKGSLYCHYEDEDYGIVFTQPGLDEANIRFATDEDCAYTMTWNTQNGEFDYLHLIDNITGMDIDCLTNEEYKFTSKTTDYKSRFRLVFGYTGVEENGEDGPSTGSGTSAFAFQMDNELVVNGEGTLQIVDLNGRVIGSQVVYGTQSTVSLPNMAAGVYVLRMIGKGGTKVQKMVIR